MLNQETKVGLLVLGGGIILTMVVVFLGDIKLQKGYNIKVLFDDIAGLPEKAPVKIAGVEVGKVSKIKLIKNKACVEVWINSKVKIQNDSKARIISTGVIGTKYLEMTMGSVDKLMLKEGDTIKGINPIGFDELIDRVMGGLDGLMGVLKSIKGKEDMGESFASILRNTRDITQKINSALGPTERDLRETIISFRNLTKNIEDFSADLKGITNESGQTVRDTIEKFDRVAEKLENILDSVASITEKVEEGEGIMGRLITDEEMAEELEKTLKNIRNASREAKRVLKRVSGFKTVWDYRLHYNIDEEMFRNNLGIRIEPNPSKFYYFSVNNLTEKKDSDYDEGDQKINSFSAQIGKRIGRFTFYGGMIRSTGGFGINYYPFGGDNILLNTEAFDFTRERDQETKAWINVGGKIKITDWWYLGINGEDILEQKTINTTVNLTFDDEDLAYLLGLAGLSSAAKR